MNNVKLSLSLALLALLVVFAVQNAELLQVRFLFWSIETRRVFILLGVLIMGIILGGFLRAYADARKNPEPPKFDPE